jgi:hypothetical protein
MNKINYVFYGKELDEFGFPSVYHSIIIYYAKVENIGVVVILTSIVGVSIDESFVLYPPNGDFDTIWIESRIKESLENNPLFESLNLQIFP